MKDARRTHFNIGRRIELADFAATALVPLLQGLATRSEVCQKLDSHKLVNRILYWTHSHPYLTQRMFCAAAESAEIGDLGKEEELIDRRLLPLRVPVSLSYYDTTVLLSRQESTIQIASTVLTLFALYPLFLRGKSGFLLY